MTHNSTPITMARVAVISDFSQAPWVGTTGMETRGQELWPRLVQHQMSADRSRRFGYKVC